MAIVVWLLVTSKFRHGYKESVMAPVGTIPDERTEAPSQPGI
jgi:hypothetical protein